MEKAKSFLKAVKPWQFPLFIGGFLILLFLLLFITPLLRRSANVKLGSNAGLIITADREDSLGAFSDTRFTLKSNTDLDLKTVKGIVTFFPEVAFDVTEISPRQFSIAPKDHLKDNSLYRIKVLSEAKTYSWAFQTKNDFRVVQTLPRDRGTFVPLNSGIEITFSHDNWENIGFKENNFEITPFVEGRFERHNRTLSFVPNSLSPDTLYTIKIKKGLKLNGSSDTLKSDYIFQFETRSPEGNRESLGFSRNFYEFSSSETPAFDIYSSVNTGSDIDVKIFQYPSLQGFYSDFSTKLSLPSWAINSNRNQKFSTSGLAKVAEFNTTIQKQIYTSYFLAPNTLPKGFYLVEAKSGNVTSQTLFQVTDLSAYLSVSGTKTLVWVNDISSGNAVAKAKVSYAGKDNETGTDGIAYFDTPASQLSDKLDIVTITSGNNTLILPPQSVNYYVSKDYQNKRRLADKFWSYLYFDRPAYLPQDKVKIWGLLRDRDDLNKKQKFTVEVTKSDYNSWDFTPVVLYSQDLETSDMGTFISEIPITNYTPGDYGITIKIGDNAVVSSSFTVETYTKPAYTISLDSSRKAIFSDESVTLSGKATFFEGTPVPNMPLKYTGPNTEGTVTSDSKGSFSFQYTPKQNNAVMSYPPETAYINVMPSRAEEGLIQSGTSVAVYGSSLVFGSQKQQVKDNIGKVDLNLRWVDTSKYVPYSQPEDIYAPAAGRQITGQVVEVNYIQTQIGTYYDFINKTTSPQYQYTEERNKIADISLTTGQDGKATYSTDLKPGKSYEVTFDSLDDKGRVARQTAYLFGANTNDRPDNYVYLKTGKTGYPSYAVNEKVDLTMMKGGNQITSGPSDKFLYLWAQRGIKSYQVSNSSQYSFNYPEAFIPSVIVQAVHFTGKTYEVAESLYLYFDTTSKKLSLSVIPNKDFYLPGDTAKLSVQTKNSSGSPVSAEVNLSLVDEAFFKLYPQTADPLSNIYKAIDADIIASYHSHQYPLDLGGAERGGCFLTGTQVLMSDGSSKSIEKIKIGDTVKTLVDPSSNKLVSAKVLDVFVHNVSGYLLINNHLRVTTEHNLYINGRWMVAGEAKVGDEYLNKAGRYQPITSIEKMSGLNTVYNLSIENEHTYFADGFYVHNDKGRSLFVDNAFFGNVTTGSDGKASVDIKLPDNLTSWRITSQAVSKDLQAGNASNPLIVKQPFFVDAVFNTEYLSVDKPVIIIRAFGDDLSSGETVNFIVQIPTLEIDRQFQAKAFEPVQINLGTLKTGDHKVTITATSPKHTDKLIRSFKVLDSRLTFAKSVNVNLAPDTVPTGSSNSYTKLVFTDQSIGRYYPSLLNLMYSWGDRLDQKIGRTMSEELIKKYFDNTIESENLDTIPFQTPDGGYAIYPYSGTDIGLSALVASLIPDRLDKANLANYFYRTFSEAKDVDTASKALFGLSSLNEPVLLLINNFANSADLTPTSKIYLAMALSQLGDTENAITKYKSLLSEFGKTQDNLMYLQIGKDKDSYLEATSTMAALASMVNEPEADSLFAYTVVNSSKETLLTSTKLLTIKNRLNSNTPSSVSFAYTLDGKTNKKSLEKGLSFTIMLSPDQLKSIKFSDIKGSVGLTTSYLVPLDQNDTEVNKSISLKRSYSISGKTTSDFSSSDLVKVSLSPSMGDLSQDGCYEVSDLLPSGLKPITSVYTLGLSTDNVWYPYEIDGQKVSFCVGKGQVNKPINYYARVISAGEYKSESALIQSLISPSIYNLSAPSSVSIK